MTGYRIVIAILISCVPLIGDAASLFVDTFPPGARVYLDGKRIFQSTPVDIENVAVGEHDLVIRPGANWNVHKETVVITDGRNKVSVALLPRATQGPSGPQGPSGVLQVIDRDGRIVGPFLGPQQASTARVLLEVGGVQFSITAAPTGLSSDPWLSELDVHSQAKFPEHSISFTGEDCTGNAYYHTTASLRPPRLVELGLVVNGSAFARDITASQSEFVSFSANSFYQVVGSVLGPGLSCINASHSGTGMPAVTRILPFNPPFRIQIP